jgi:hypothetical protein
MITPLDLSWLVDEFSSTTITLNRPTEGYDSNGLRTTSSVTTTFNASVQPITGLDLQRMPQGFQDKYLVSVWSKTQLFLRDQLVINGDKFEVQHTDDWQGNGTYHKVIAQRLDIRETV